MGNIDWTFDNLKMWWNQLPKGVQHDVSFPRFDGHPRLGLVSTKGDSESVRGAFFEGAVKEEKPLAD